MAGEDEGKGKVDQEAAAAQEAEEKRTFGEGSEDSVFGPSIKDTAPPSEKGAEAAKEEGAATKEDEAGKGAKEPEKKSGEEGLGKGAEAAKGADEKVEELIVALAGASPEFKAEIIDKKGIKSLFQLTKLFREQEGEFTRRSGLLNTYRKALEPYAKFDEHGNFIEYTEKGKKALAALDEKGETPQAGPKVATAAAKPAAERTPEEKAALEQLKTQFWAKFEDDPIGTLVAISQIVSGEGSKGIKGEFAKSIEALQTQLKPVFERMEEERLLDMIDEFAKEQIAAGDDKAQEFIDTYADEIEAELKKLPAETRKVPKLAIEQAYLRVKNAKVEEWKKEVAKKEEEAQAGEHAAAGTGTPSGAGSGSVADRESDEVFGKPQSPGSVFD